MTIDQCRAHIGDKVLWLPRGGPADSAEEGVITSVTDRQVYVGFTGALFSHAIDPACLTLLAAR